MKWDDFKKYAQQRNKEEGKNEEPRNKKRGKCKRKKLMNQSGENVMYKQQGKKLKTI